MNGIKRCLLEAIDNGDFLIINFAAKGSLNLWGEEQG